MVFAGGSHFPFSQWGEAEGEPPQRDHYQMKKADKRRVAEKWGKRTGRIEKVKRANRYVHGKMAFYRCFPSHKEKGALEFINNCE
jgi:hypothetical protein